MRKALRLRVSNLLSSRVTILGVARTSRPGSSAQCHRPGDKKCDVFLDFSKLQRDFECDGPETQVSWEVFQFFSALLRKKDVSGLERVSHVWKPLFLLVYEFLVLQKVAVLKCSTTLTGAWGKRLCSTIVRLVNPPVPPS
jgi:hypothetical protein